MDFLLQRDIFILIWYSKEDKLEGAREGRKNERKHAAVCFLGPMVCSWLAPSAGLLGRTPGVALRTSLLRSTDVRGAPHPASAWCAHAVKVPTVLTLQWYSHGFAVNFLVAFVAEFACTTVLSSRFCGQLLRGRVC